MRKLSVVTVITIFSALGLFAQSQSQQQTTPPPQNQKQTAPPSQNQQQTTNQQSNSQTPPAAPIPTKKKVQLVVVANKDMADYVIGGTAEDKKAGWAKIIFLGDIHSDATASVTMVDQKSSAVLFAYAVNKKNTWHGDQTTAEACAKHLQAHIEGRE
jgi:hypothetical protein